MYDLQLSTISDILHYSIHKRYNIFLIVSLIDTQQLVIVIFQHYIYITFMIQKILFYKNKKIFFIKNEKIMLTTH